METDDTIIASIRKEKQQIEEELNCIFGNLQGPNISCDWDYAFGPRPIKTSYNFNEFVVQSGEQ